MQYMANWFGNYSLGSRIQIASYELGNIFWLWLIAVRYTLFYNSKTWRFYLWVIGISVSCVEHHNHHILSDPQRRLSCWQTRVFIFIFFTLPNIFKGTVMIFITPDSEVIMFSPCVFVCVCVCLSMFAWCLSDDLTMKDWCHTNNILQVHCWGCLIVQVMFHALMTSLMTSQDHKVGQILILIYLRQYLS